MNADDLQALGRLLDSYGLSLSLSDAQGRLSLANHSFHTRGAAPGHTQVITLHDGRQLMLSRPAGDAPAGGDQRFALLAQHALDLMMAVDDNLLIHYASPASQAMLQRSPDSLLGHSLAELLAADDRAAFIARHFTRSATRGGPDLFRALRADGGALWVEARVASLPPGNGLGQFLVTLRDADRRRRAEEALAERNAELAALAATDALTGLANRRQFDAALTREWYRALREHQPLGLLMIDVDRFKSLNDLFGHQIGDAVLQRVGRVIRDTVRRAGDLPTRYGGEEFAVVLPGTNLQGALEIAEAIRRAVRAADTRDIIDGGHPISVSIGAAAAVPQPDSSAPSLLHVADAALYQAKNSGRDRVVSL